MWYVYILRSKSHDGIYIGSTNDLHRRLAEHNGMKSLSTKSGVPWHLESYIALRSETRARALEKYFKTGSGKAILKKRILGDEALA